jgi:hypothetical protein
VPPVRLLEPADAHGKSLAVGARVKLDMVMLDWFDVAFKQPTRAAMDYAELNIDDAADQQNVKSFVLDNFIADTIKVFDLAAREVLAPRPFQLENSWAVNLERKARPTTLVALSEERMLRPFEMKAVTLPGIFAQSSDCELLILTHPAFAKALEPLAAWKRSRGLKTELVEITDLFNEAAGGYAGPETLRNYI